MKSINVGVIGTGSISAMHLQSYEKHANANLLAVCDLNEERAQRATEKYGATKVYTNYNELLADPEIDAVSICTWNNTHAEISIAALNAGKHVLVEKPLCRTVEEALQVQEAVKSSGKLLQVGFVRRYDPNAQMLREFADKGEFGRSTSRRLPPFVVSAIQAAGSLTLNVPAADLSSISGCMSLICVGT